MTILPSGVASAGATDAYSKVLDFNAVFDSAQANGADSANSTSFGATLQRALDGVAQTGQEADRQAVQGLSGEGNVTDIVMAVSKAQLALQSTIAIRDKVVQAYQDIMKMSI